MTRGNAGGAQAASQCFLRAVALTVVFSSCASCRHGEHATGVLRVGPGPEEQALIEEIYQVSRSCYVRSQRCEHCIAVSHRLKEMLRRYRILRPSRTNSLRCSKRMTSPKESPFKAGRRNTVSLVTCRACEERLIKFPRPSRTSRHSIDPVTCFVQGSCLVQMLYSCM